jgi:iron complex outermembrane receptor protein
MHSSPASRSWLIAAAVATALAAPTAALSQEDQEFEEIVVTGTRKGGQSPTETLSPVDMLSGSLLSDQATFDLTDGLPKVSPSLNTQRFPIADGTAFIRPVTLRNLAPDQTLVLMNGTRRHRSALVNLQLAPLGTVNQGSQGVDFAAFPAAAIERVEILRDGASAQYGSDAIAGVINVILKDAPEGGTLSAQYGEYYESDGERLSVSGNIGLPLGADGFVNLAGEYSESDITWRGHPRGDAVALEGILGPGVVPLNGYGQRWGDPDVEALKFSVNAGIDLTDSVELYGFATYMDNTTKSDFFFRRPVLANPADQLALSARNTLQIDNCTGACNPDPLLNAPDGLPDPATPGQIADIENHPLFSGDLNDYLTQDGSSPTGYVLRNPIYTNFPGGYNPDFGADLTDMAFVLGLRGDLTDTLTWDITGRYAEDEVEYTLSESINPSLGGTSPLSFTPGVLTQEESGINLDLVKTFTNSPLNIAFGGEFRNETYTIDAGDEASRIGGPAFIFGVGSDGFQGFPSDSAGEFKSDSYAAYVDVETDITDRLSGAVAVRYEDYDEFGDTTDWKVSGRYQFTDAFAVRATANTGFRAPTPGQVHTLNTTTTANSAGDLVPSGTYPVSSPVGIALGAVPLKPEESDAYTVGLVWDAGNRLSFTLDYYHIEIDERLALRSATVDQAAVDQLIAAGIPPAEANPLLGSAASFFVNGFDSEIEGIDLAATAAFDLGGGDLLVDFRHNYNTQKISDVDTATINDARVYDLENQIPENRSVLSFNWDSGGLLGALLRLNYYDGWSSTGGLFNETDPPTTFDYGSTLLVDAEVSMTFNEMFTVTLGGENVFDEYPDKEGDPTLDALGDTYAVTSPYGFNGGFYYLRLSMSF